MNTFCGIEIVGEAIAIEADTVKYHEYPKLEESTVGEDESLEQEFERHDEVDVAEVDEPETTFSRLVVCYQRADVENREEETSEYVETPSRCGASSSGGGFCLSANKLLESPKSKSTRLTSSTTREILERSGSKLLLQPDYYLEDHEKYPENAPNLLEDCDFEILAPQDANDEGQEEEVQVLNPDIMEDLQSHLPITKKGESFWLQYSLIRDGASMESLLYKIRNTDHCVLAIETVDGDVFGAYTSQRWQLHADFFGSRDAFLWRKNSDPKEGEEDVQCYHFSHLNNDVQLCTHDRLAVGGGIRKFDPQYGFGISLDRDLLTGTTSKSMTFLNPPLSKHHADGSTFEIRNVEVWALTPCLSLEDAERVAERVQNKPIWA